MSGGGSKFAVGRFFVSTPVPEGGAGGGGATTPPKAGKGGWAGVAAPPDGSNRVGGSLLVDSSTYSTTGDVAVKNSRKRVKKYGQYIPISYPEPTIHEETSPGDTEVGERGGGDCGGVRS